MSAEANRTVEVTITERSRLLCKAMAVATAVTAFAIPLLVVWSLWDFSDARLAEGFAGSIGVGIEIENSSANSIRTLLALPSLVMSYALLALFRFFGALSRSQAFDPATYGHLRKFSVALAVNLPAAIIAQVLSVLLIDASVPNGFTLSLRLGTPQIFTLGTAILTYVLARVLSEACALADENRQFV